LQLRQESTNINNNQHFFLDFSFTFTDLRSQKLNSPGVISFTEIFLKAIYPSLRD